MRVKAPRLVQISKFSVDGLTEALNRLKDDTIPRASYRDILPSSVNWCNLRTHEESGDEYQSRVIF